MAKKKSEKIKLYSLWWWEFGDEKQSNFGVGCVWIILILGFPVWFPVYAGWRLVSEFGKAMNNIKVRYEEIEEEYYYAAIPFDNLEAARKMLEKIHKELRYGGWVIKETRHYIMKRSHQKTTWETYKKGEQTKWMKKKY